MECDGVIVLGMHRSGTSAVTSMLEAMGLYVGTPHELTATSWENPRGFYERRDLRRLCDGLLRGAGAEWWRTSAFSADAIPPSVLAEHEAAIRALADRLDGHRPWAIKEPRLCLLLPVFERLARRAVIVHPVRHPLEVARSLSRRNGIPLCVGIALWERYNRAALAHSRGRPRVTVDYTQLAAEPARECRRIANELRSSGIAALDTEAAAARIEPGLRRERAGDGATGDFVGPPQAALWRAVTADDTAGADSECSATVLDVLGAYERDMAQAPTAGSGAQQAGALNAAPALRAGEHDGELENLRRALERERACSDALRASRSWRLTAPLRVLGRWRRRLLRG